jgi:hypothetical protein
MVSLAIQAKATPTCIVPLVDYFFAQIPSNQTAEYRCTTQDYEYINISGAGLRSHKYLGHLLPMPHGHSSKYCRSQQHMFKYQNSR